MSVATTTAPVESANLTAPGRNAPQPPERGLA